VTSSLGNQVLNIALDELMPDPSQPRKQFLDEEIKRLAASIAARGILQPLRVIRDEQRQVWLIVTGESRYRASRLVPGLTTVPCLPVTGDLSEAELLADRLTENDCRNELTPMEMAHAIARLKAIKMCSSKALVDEYGFSGAAISKAEAMLTLPPDIQELIGSGPGQIAPATAYELSRLPTEGSQRELAHEVIAKHLPRQAVVEAVQAKVGKRNIVPRQGRLSCKHDGVSITLSSGKPLDWESIISTFDHIRKQAKKLAEEGKEVTALSKVLRSS
jgi:ParB family chromosome partitioning protein